jgi:hypothetical protein
MRQDRFAEGALPTKHRDFEKDKKKFFKKNQALSSKLMLISFRIREDL